MRYMKLILSVLIGIVGMVIYFVSMPTIDEDKMVEMTVEAGDESLLDGMYFTGYMMDYSSFLFDENGVAIYDELPFLQQLDTREHEELAMLQSEHPDFMNELLFDMNTYAFGISTNEEYLVSGSIMQNPEDYSAQFNQLNIQVLDKQTGEMKTDSIQRENFPTGDTVDFLGIYQEYPTIKFLINTGTWDMTNYEETAKISLIEYNIETKDYTEENILKADGYIYSYGYGIVSTNKSLLTLALAPNYEDTNIHLFNFTDHSLEEIGESQDYFIVSEDSQLYSLTNEEGRSMLNHYGEDTKEISGQTELNLEERIDFTMEFPGGISTIVDNKLYLVESQYVSQPGATAEIPPSTLYVFDIETGEKLLESTIHYDTENQSTAYEAFIETIGFLSNFN